MLKLCRVTKVLFLVLLSVFYCDFFKFLAAFLEKGLLTQSKFLYSLKKNPLYKFLEIKDVTMAIVNVVILIHLQPAQLIQVQLLQVDVS